MGMVCIGVFLCSSQVWAYAPVLYQSCVLGAPIIKISLNYHMIQQVHLWVYTQKKCKLGLQQMLVYQCPW